MSVPDLRFIIQGEGGNGDIGTFYVCLHKTTAPFPSTFAPAKAFHRKQICYLFYVLSPAEFSESLTTPGLLKMVQIISRRVEYMSQLKWLASEPSGSQKKVVSQEL